MRPDHRHLTKPVLTTGTRAHRRQKSRIPATSWSFVDGYPVGDRQGWTYKEAGFDFYMFLRSPPTRTANGGYRTTRSGIACALHLISSSSIDLDSRGNSSLRPRSTSLHRQPIDHYSRGQAFGSEGGSCGDSSPSKDMCHRITVSAATCTSSGMSDVDAHQSTSDSAMHS